MIAVTRIAHRWAGLRSFVADRTPTAGFDPGAPGFFWLAGQGGYGLQTAPAMASVVEFSGDRGAVAGGAGRARRSAGACPARTAAIFAGPAT